MNNSLRWTIAGAAMCLAAASFAQVPADAPAGTTGLCNDGTYYSGATKKGACRGHKGVKDWYGAPSSTAGGAAPAAAKPAAPAAAAPATPAAAATPAPAPAAAAASKPAASASTKFTPPANPAPGGGPGLVWVNTSSKVYHCQGDKWYGKTKAGEYMSEADAKSKGYRAERGKTCG